MINDSKKRLFEVMARLDKTFKPKLNENIDEADVDEGGYPRLKRMMSGDVNAVNTIGIFTAENPQAMKVSPEENNKRMDNLKSTLRSLNYGFIKIKGKYGNFENSLVVPNITLNDIAKLSKQFNQESYIFGEKQAKFDDSNQVYFVWNMYNTMTNEPMDNERYTILSNRENLETAEDFYSIIKNVKFKIPFFDDEKYDEPEKQDYLYKPENKAKDVVNQELNNY
jgi:hypothetical protein